MPKKAKILRLARSALVLKVTLREASLPSGGGGHGYAELLEAIADPSNERHEGLREWVGPDFDPEAFDLAAVNRALRGVGREE